MTLSVDITALTIASALCAVGATALLLRRLTKSSALPYPPGPPSRGLVGNLTDVPKDLEWEVYADWGRKYGPVSHFRILTKHFIILNSFEAAVDLLNKRSAIYSNRPTFTMQGELMGWQWNTALINGDRWRAHRRILHHYLHESMAQNYRPIHARAVVQLLQAFLDTPEDFYQHIRRWAAAGTLPISHGIDVTMDTTGDHWINLADEAFDTIAAAGLPGAWAVDWIPALKYLPEWIPGAGFQRKAQEWKRLAVQMRDATFDLVQSQTRLGTAPPSVAAELSQNGFAGESVHEEVIRNVAGVLYLGGADTTVSPVQSFMYAMVTNQDKQRLAQAEIDRVVGRDRLPDHSDKDSLPYVSALILEVYRLYPSVPLGVPHCPQEDDVYMGMCIPKGATVIANSWGMLRNEGTYPEPHSFLPERFLKEGRLDPTVQDPRIPVFGWGRRVCVGQPVAESSIWLVITSILACFSITPAKDEYGNNYVPQLHLRSGFVTLPRPFPCTITPRSEAHRQLVAAASDQL
ncbi:cytochrome P450 [Exidia glandulosa HHB12029]|uniref:Cytochrome P450 n=1 Tax=Exidia glandulosa HHB12029 TaxID=1314781 RepID=A0A165JBQ6_EXIGL|nr:cytochrome P450 [Exidia glandulosa HHB12029]